MLAGEPPFTGPTMQAMIVKRLTEPPPSVRATRPNVPEAVDLAIRKALAPVAADRFASAAELARALVPAAPTIVDAAGGQASGLRAATGERTGGRTTGQAAGSRQRRVPVLALSLVLGMLIGLGVLFAWRRGHPDARPTAAPSAASPCSPSRTWATRPTPTSPTASPTRCAASSPRCRACG